MHAVVVGAGVIGAAVAFRLAQVGVRVTVLESADRVGAGTSGRSFAWTNSNGKTPRAYHDLNVAGMQAHAALAEEFGSAPWWHGGGNLEWRATDSARAGLTDRVERLRAWGYAVEWLTRDRLHTLEPDLDVNAVGDAPIAFYPLEGWLDPIVYVHAMLHAAAAHGALVRTREHVEQVLTNGGRVRGVALRGGQRIDTDWVINCAGRWADTLEVEDIPRLRLPLAPTFGLLVFTPPVASGLQRVVHAPSINMRPDGAGRLMLHADDVDDALAPEAAPGVESPIVAEMLTRAAAVLPAIGQVAAEAVRIGIRAMPADGLSAVGPMPGIDGYYVVVTHSGVTLSPFLARVVADEIAHDSRDARLEPFRPERLLDARGRARAGTRPDAAARSADRRH
jgi:glycine/D-amino acid oxidase-like deaminating enzyme